VKTKKHNAQKEAKKEVLTAKQKIRREIFAWFWIVLIFRDGAVWINGEKLKENYTVGRTERLNAPLFIVAFPYHVPENCYFAMGDNREDSYDSRVVGCVPRHNIIVAPVMIYMSLDARSDAWESGHVRDRISAYADAVLHPGTVRWKRLFHTF
jgi:type IV secretory pathway protease TraF